MVHNGIEYGDMQLISEAYLAMRDEFKLSNDAMATFFEQWNKAQKTKKIQFCVKNWFEG